MTCRELQLDFEIPGGFGADHEIVHEILHKICASGMSSSKWKGSDPKDFFTNKITYLPTSPFNVRLSHCDGASLSGILQCCHKCQVLAFHNCHNAKQNLAFLKGLKSDP